MPSSLGLVGHSVPRSRCFAVIAAPTMAAPEGSVTRPVIPALISWAGNNAALNSTVVNTNRSCLINSLCPIVPLLQLYVNPSLRVLYLLTIYLCEIYLKGDT